ncbi:MAG: hypothetical protein KAR06_02385 [Deltaproteobacteria bacterium]|nr:hypothetical protein [Deltaproteobacteria bacterium]
MAIEEEEEVVEEVSAEDFGEAFGEDEGTPPIEEPEKDEAKEEPTPAEPEKEELPEVPEIEEEPVKPEEKEEKPVADDAAVDDKPTYEELEARLEKTGQQYSTLQGMYNAGLKKEPLEEEEPEPETDFSADIAGIVEKVSNLESVKNADDEVGEGLSKTLVEVTGLITKEVLSTMDKRQEQRFGKISEEVKPLQEHYVNAETREHLNTIQTAHPDFMKYVESGELKVWVESQGGLKKSLYGTVYDTGKASDVVDMVAEFRNSKGYNEAPKKEQKKEVDTSKLEDMEAIEAKKSPVNTSKAGSSSEDDFGAALEED